MRLDARLGARGAKRKIKRTETLDAVVVDVKGGSAFAVWAGQTFRVGTGRHSLARGAVIEVAFNGLYEAARYGYHTTKGMFDLLKRITKRAKVEHGLPAWAPSRS